MIILSRPKEEIAERSAIIRADLYRRYGSQLPRRSKWLDDIELSVQILYRPPPSLIRDCQPIRCASGVSALGDLTVFVVSLASYNQ